MKAKIGNVKECKTLIKHQLVRVNHCVIDDPKYIVNMNDVIEVDNQRIEWPFVYYMLHKPQGYLSASYDLKEHYVLEIFHRKDCFCLGRLDKDTTGLLIVTNDTSLKKMLLPQNHITKTYEVLVNKRLDKNLITQFFQGIIIDNDVLCLPAKLEIIDEDRCYVTLTEGKYHQVKKMFLSCGYHVMALKRISFHTLTLDKHLKEGEYRELLCEEVYQICKRGGNGYVHK